jgi:hypothetical protein
MEGHIKYLGFSVWQWVKSFNTSPTTPIIDQTEIRLYECNAKAKNDILCGLANLEMLKVMNCRSTKDSWEKPTSIYEGDSKVKNTHMDK